MKRAPFEWPKADPTAKTYWRTMDELAQKPEFTEFMEREFPAGASELISPISRRSFMHLMGASLALAGLTACRRPEQKILPYAETPENTIIGVPRFYASTFTLGREALGVLVESHEGRPTKIEGNPAHPASGMGKESGIGSSNSFAQAAILELYDPDRSATPMLREGTGGARSVSWEAAEKALTAALSQAYTPERGIYVLAGAMTSPTVARLQKHLIDTGVHWHTWEPVNDDNARAAARIAFGGDYLPRYDLKEADVIVCLGSDPLGLDDDALRHSREFAKRRVPENGEMNRLYSMESSWTITGTSADHRLRVKPSEMVSVAIHLAKELAKHGISIPAQLQNASIPASLSVKSSKFIQALAKDLTKGRAVIIPGAQQSVETHLIAHLLNDALRRARMSPDAFVGPYTVIRQQPMPLDFGKTLDRDSITSLVRELNAGRVGTLIILGGNPVYDAPVDVNFAEALKKAGSVVHLGLYRDETAQAAHLHIPRAHFLESWGDAQTTDGTKSLIQPMIAPLYNGWSDIELLGRCTQMFEPAKRKGTIVSTKGYDLVKQTFPSMAGWVRDHDDVIVEMRAGFAEAEWRTALKDGLLRLSEKSDFQPLQKDKVFAALKTLPTPSAAQELEISFLVDSSVYDGRFANNGWLQELPNPITKMVWDNAALVSPATAKKLGLELNKLAEITVQGKTLQAAVFILPGQADDTISIALGYGRTVTGRVGRGAGFNAYTLRHSDGLWFAQGTAKNTGLSYEDSRLDNWIDINVTKEQRRKLATVQEQYSMDTESKFSLNPTVVSTDGHFPLVARNLVIEGTLEKFEEDHHFIKERIHEHPPLKALWDETRQPGQQWGMTIDLSRCTGCGTCTIACQAENNIPIVGKAQVRKGREMHWIRVDRYFSGDVDEPEAMHQPLPCMQCENAPCENVCPVGATVHSQDGLNDMVYNRCIGTRYCANNCPYKVRRFNFLDYRGDVSEVEKLKYNPDVTLRQRGVMEKCTYCVQRIRAKQKEQPGGAPVPDGTIKTACSQACPTQAITFGDVSDPKSDVSKLKENPRNYDIIVELDTRPRTSYLARIRNPNPELA